jgi:hypothetical protein
VILALCLLLSFFVPFVLSSGGFPEPSAGARRAALIFGGILSAPAGIAWLFGVKTMPLVALAFAPAYQLELYARLALKFRRRYGRDLQLIAFRIVSGEQYDDVRYSNLYFVSAMLVPLLAFAILWF